MDTNQTNTVIEEIKKDILTTNTMGQAGNTGLSRQDLSAIVTKLTNRATELRDRVKRKQGSGLAHAWNLRSSLGLGATKPIDVFYAENALPSVTTSSYTQVSAAYTRLGLEANVSNFAIAAGKTFMDLEAETTEATMRAVIQAEEWSMFHGDGTTTNDNSQVTFKGLDSLLSTNVINVGATLGATTDILDEMINRIRYQGGGTGRLGIFCSFGQQRFINQIQQKAGDLRVNLDINNVGNVTLGQNVTFYQSPVGKIPIIGDFFVNPVNPYPYNAAGSSSATGNTSSNIYFVDLDYLSMVDLQPLVKEDLAFISDNKRFLIKEYSVMEVTAEPWMGILTNVTEPTPA